jgi:hypothetical protein
MAAGFPSDLGQTDLLKRFSNRRHLGDKALLHEPAFLTTSVGIQFVIEADGREFFLPEPRLQRHIETDIDRGAITGQDDDILRATGKSHRERPLKSGRDGILIAEQRVNVVDRDVWEDEAGAAGRPHHDGVFRIRKRGKDITERHGLRTSGAERVLFNELLGSSDIFPAAVLVTVRRPIYQILIFGRHDIEKLRRNFNSLFTHGWPPNPASVYVRLFSIRY